jgi:hypothetical protein
MILEEFKKIETKCLEILNSEQFMSEMLDSPRAVGDAVQEFLAKRFEECLSEIGFNFNSDFSRRSMADLAFNDKEGNYHVVDIKTHSLDGEFSMPNLISIERLFRFYEDSKNFFDLLLVDYSIENDRIVFKKVKFQPIENLDLNCLTIGALGWGQLQIKSMEKVNFLEIERGEWLLKLLEKIEKFYDTEKKKIESRKEHFSSIKNSLINGKK